MKKSVHELKTWPKYFQATLNGSKPFEVRVNDRDFHVGETFISREWDHDMGDYTGRRLRAVISYVLESPVFGVKDGFSVLGLQGIEQLKDSMQSVFDERGRLRSGDLS